MCYEINMPKPILLQPNQLFVLNIVESEKCINHHINVNKTKKFDEENN
jgi:hypothetical protein